MQASREYSLKDTVLSRWKQEFLERARHVFEHPQAMDQSEQRIAELERIVERRAMELEMAKKGIEVLVLGTEGKRVAVRAMQEYLKTPIEMFERFPAVSAQRSRLQY
jgi:hypothetical protein